MERGLRFLAVAILTYPANFWIVRHINDRSLAACFLFAALISIFMGFLFTTISISSKPISKFFVGTILSISSCMVCIFSFNDYSFYISIMGSFFIASVFGWLFASFGKTPLPTA